MSTGKHNQKQPKKTGRPNSYTDELADAICEGIAMGKPLVALCEQYKLSYSTVTKWLRTMPEFAANYTQAREDQADWHHDAILSIADDSNLTPEDRRVRIDARKWSAGKMRPKKYGDKLALGGDENAPPIRHAMELTVSEAKAIKKALDEQY